MRLLAIYSSYFCADKALATVWLYSVCNQRLLYSIFSLLASALNSCHESTLPFLVREASICCLKLVSLNAEKRARLCFSEVTSSVLVSSIVGL